MNISTANSPLPLTRKELAAHYGVSIYIITCWLKELPEIEIPARKQFTPSIVRRIMEELGEP